MTTSKKLTTFPMAKKEATARNLHIKMRMLPAKQKVMLFELARRMKADAEKNGDPKIAASSLTQVAEALLGILITKMEKSHD